MKKVIIALQKTGQAGDEMKLSCGNILNLKRGEIKVFYGEITLDHDDMIRAWITCPGKAECLSNEGQNYLGEWFDKLDKCAKANVPKRLWFYVKAPDAAGKYNGTIKVTNTARKVFSDLTIVLNVSEEVFDGDSFANQKNLNRLFWLNSKLAQNSDVPKPFVPLTYENNTVKFLGREIELDELGLPKKITSFFDEKIAISEKRYEILSDKIKFTVAGESFKTISSGAVCEEDTLSFSSVSESASFMMKIRAKIEFDGFCDYSILLIAKRGTKLSDVNLCLPISEYSSKYFMGLGHEGGKFEAPLNFKWSADKHQDSFWVGNVNAGIRVKFKGENYKKPLTDTFYKYKPLVMPKSWDNSGFGGIRYEDGKFIVYSGERNLNYGEKLEFNFNLSVTPIKPLADKFKGSCGLYEYSLCAFPKTAPEFEALCDFDTELIELHNGVAVCNGESRICNYFTEDVNRLADNSEFGGIVLHGAEIDRNTMKRLRKVLDKREGARIELALDNQYNMERGFANTFCTYAELLPYVDKLLIKDEAEKTYEYRLLELSGIPFGIANEEFRDFSYTK